MKELRFQKKYLQLLLAQKIDVKTELNLFEHMHYPIFLCCLAGGVSSVFQVNVKK